MDAKLKAKWVKALRSGKYGQARYVLATGGTKPRLCCIGVACVTTRLHPARSLRDKSTPLVAAKLGLTNIQTVKLVDMNDYEKKNFKQIADYIEKYL